MAPLQVVLVGPLRRYVQGQELISLDDWSGHTIFELLERLGVPSRMVAAAMLDGRMVRKSQVLNEGEELKLIPVLGGG
jgi:sulfur carrier protein ThiS